LLLTYSQLFCGIRIVVGNVECVKSFSARNSDLF
jgi:hypothetical protein